LLDALSGCASNCGKQRGAVLLNGQSISSSQLRDRVAYVQCDSHLSPDLSVTQTLSLHHWLRYSNAHHSKLSTKDRVSCFCVCCIRVIHCHLIRTEGYYMMVVSDHQHNCLLCFIRPVTQLHVLTTKLLFFRLLKYVKLKLHLPVNICVII
jgi:hypothetical protein